jgi:hypothetical protein
MYTYTRVLRTYMYVQEALWKAHQLVVCGACIEIDVCMYLQ